MIGSGRKFHLLIKRELPVETQPQLDSENREARQDWSTRRYCTARRANNLG
jgi:hypothetical protein